MIIIVIAVYVAVFVLGYAADRLTCHWHHLRESGSVWRTAGVSMILEALSWLPILFVFYTADWRIALISVLGSGWGTAAGLRAIHRQKGDSVIPAAVARDTPSRSPSLQD